MAAIIDTGLLTAGLRSEFLARLSGTPTVWQDLATTIKSNKDREAFKFLGSVPPMREWGTGRLARGLRTESYDVVNQKYELTLEVDRDELSDDQTGQISIRIGEMAARAAQHKDLLIAELLANGGETGFNSYDGVPFFSGSHVSGASGTQDNDLTLECADATDPTVAEFKAAVKQAVQAMLGYKDDQGEPMSAGASGLMLVVAPGLYFTALEAMSATLIGNTDNVLKGAARVVAFPRITDPAVFYTVKTDGVVRPFVFQDREPLEFNELTEKSETGFLREVYLYGVRARYAMTYGYWQYAVRTTLETAEGETVAKRRRKLEPSILAGGAAEPSAAPPPAGALPTASSPAKSKYSVQAGGAAKPSASPPPAEVHRHGPRERVPVVTGADRLRIVLAAKAGVSIDALCGEAADRIEALSNPIRDTRRRSIW